MARQRVVFVFDYPNIEACWWSVAQQRHLAGSWVDWQVLMQQLKSHAIEKYGVDIEFDFRLFKNRNRAMSAKHMYDVIAKEKTLMVMGYRVIVNVRNAGHEDSDIDDHILAYVEQSALDQNTIAIYMIGSDLKNHNKIAGFVVEKQIDCWYVLMSEIFTSGRPKLPEGVKTLRIERLPGVLKYSGDNEYTSFL